MDRRGLAELGTEIRRHKVKMADIGRSAAAAVLADERDNEPKTPVEQYDEIAQALGGFQMHFDGDAPGVTWTRAVPVRGTDSAGNETVGYLRFIQQGGGHGRLPTDIVAQWYIGDKEPGNPFDERSADFTEGVNFSELDAPVAPAADRLTLEQRLAGLRGSLQTYQSALEVMGTPAAG